MSRSRVVRGLRHCRPIINGHRFAKKSFDPGREEVYIGEGFKVGLYSAERSPVDVT